MTSPTDKGNALWLLLTSSSMIVEFSHSLAVPLPPVLILNRPKRMEPAPSWKILGSACSSHIFGKPTQDLAPSSHAESFKPLALPEIKSGRQLHFDLPHLGQNTILVPSTRGRTVVSSK
jgi:hypothetical protein